MNPSIIKIIQQYFSDQPVEKVWVFGSFARGEQTANSDIDLLVSFDPTAQVSLLDHSAMICDLERLLSRKIDLIKEGTLLPFAVESANSDKKLVYERAR